MAYAVNKGFNSASAILTFPTTTSTIGELRSLTVSVGGSVIDVGAQDDLAMLSVLGRDDFEITTELVGSTTLERGDIGHLNVTWNDGGDTEDIAGCVITQVSTSGSMDGEITSSITFKQSS